MSGPGITQFNPTALRRVRTHRRLTLRELALLAGVGATTLSGWETGRRTPSPRALTEVARALRVDVSVLVPVAQSKMLLRDLRHQAGLSQESAARSMGFSQGVYQAIESGHRLLGDADAAKVADVLETSPELILELHSRGRAAVLARIQPRD